MLRNHGVSAATSPPPGAPKEGASPASPARVSARMAARLVRVIEGRGTRPEALGIDRALLQDPDARLEVPLVDRWIEAAASALGARGLGMAIAMTIDPETYGAAGKLLLAARTLREGFELALRHQRLWGDGDRFAMRADASGLTIRFVHPGASVVAKSVLAEVALIEIMCAAKGIAGPGANAQAVRFAHRSMGDDDVLGGLFGTVVTFEAGSNEIELPAAVAEAPIPREHLVTALAADATRAHDAIAPPPPTFAARVRAVATDFPSLSDAARRLGASPRTVQRRLSAEGTSYFALLDAIRRDAVAELSARGASEKAIAMEVGFSDDRALHRARRRWARRGDADELK